ncbi:ABC transporter permease [Lapidilactobacillus wuchangensis]|uniref:ABC transporter permease n=1 Tax=Lapidilactobacillus wuchangensis TaxID=2486001 RepID=UPI0013DDA046|nr:ABC transporter permease [Lapidilactobacillus wuchangensis]
MFDFQTLWSHRLKQHLRQQNKYLRYVFNDHLILAVVFVVGALAFWYSNALQQITQPLWWAGPVVIIILALVLLIGRLAILLVKADQIFLLPREAQLGRYLKQAQHYSLALPTFVMIFAGLVLTPFVLRATSLAGWSWLSIVLSLFVYKDLDLSLMANQLLRQPADHKMNFNRRWLVLAAVLSWILGFYVFGGLALIVAVLANVAWCWTQKTVFQTTQLNWRLAIEQESSRQFRLLRFYNLFVDVPEVGGHVVSNKLINVCLNWWRQRQPGTFSYLYQSAFLRRTDYLNIWLRFLVIGMVLLALIQQPIVVVILFLLFIYLAGYQLIPLFHHFDHNPMTQLYPTTSSERQHDFERMLQPLLFIQWLGYSIVVALNGQQLGWWLVLGLIGGGLVMIILFLRLYLPGRLTKKKRS